MKTIDVIIPNYNGSALIKKNLPFVLAAINDYENAGVIISDDGSRSDEAKKLEEVVAVIKKTTDKKITLIMNKKNLGFSSNINKGAFSSLADYLVLLNSDVAPEKDFLKESLRHFDTNPNLYGVGFMDKSIESGRVVLRGRGKAYWTRGFLIHEKGEVDNDETFWISGGSSIVRRNIFEKLGGFDSIYNPFYWEDIDLSYRAVKSGHEVVFENKSIVEHRHEEGTIKKHYKTDAVNTTAYRNQFFFVWTNITDFSLLFSHILWLPVHVIKAFLRLDKPFIFGLGLAIMNFSTVVSSRKRHKKLFIRNDREIIKKIK